jgi:glycosyltransferase involved in cell wall biosynthesis
VSKPLFCHVFATFAMAGPQVRTAKLINALAGQYRHVVIAMDGNTGCASRLDPNADARFEPAPSARAPVVAPIALARQLRAIRPDLVLTYNWGAIEAVPAARLAGVRRVIHTEDGFRPDEAQGQKTRRILYRRAVLPFASAVVAPSLTLIRMMTDVWRLPGELVLHIENGIDCDHYAPGDGADGAAVRASLAIPPGACVIGTVAHLRPEKNQLALVDALAALLPGLDVHLLVVGDGPDKERLQRRAAELGIAARTHFVGQVPDAREHYRAIDIFALSSHTEQMPISLLEAMATGCAVASTDVGDIAAMVSEANRPFVVPRGDPAAFTQALVALVRDEPKRRELGEANRAACLARYTEGRMIDSWAKLYQRVLR